ncbi:two-component sensor histidine kinase [Streptomyces kaniharaensis]|uniref:histidine kinase n=1 Tax=Streptomyces kaniharaensis TaxID=212423 RepID=A0A6N7KWT2_9ACTN|nr:histidine kinase [Streptomyces kaniharaensis]MQS16122.1 two-component sensor histidine kinase [Streptomyces kaniharaensis]
MPRSLRLTCPATVAALGLCVLLVLLDASVVSVTHVGLAVVASGVAALGGAGAQLRLYRFGRQWTACALSVVVATLSLLTTSLVEGTVLQRTPGWAELVGLLVLLCLSCRYGRTVPLVLSTIPLFVAVVRIEGRAPELADLPLLKDINGLFTLLPAAFALLGGYLRTEDGRRQTAAQNVRRAERLDLARDLHDHVAHYVTAIVVQAQAGEHTAERDPVTARELFTNIEQTGQEGLAAMSRMVRLLREADGATTQAPVTPVMTRIDALVRQFSGTGQPAWLDVADDVDDALWSPQLAKTVERLVQEGLTNIRKHARTATTVHVRMETDEDRLVVRVRDNAVGQQRGRVWFRPSGFGMVGLSERVAELGGELSSGRMPEGGWELAASIPVK